MSEKLESGLEVVGYLAPSILSEHECFSRTQDQVWKVPLVRQSDAERALSERDAEIQRQRERHRTTWTQLEQVKGLLRSEFPLLDDNGLDENDHHCEWAIQQDRKRLHAMLAALSQQAEPDDDGDHAGRVLETLLGWQDEDWHWHFEQFPELAERVRGQLPKTEPAPTQDEREAQQCLFVLREIGSMDAEDISGDDVDLRFEDGEGRDTGCDISIVEYAQRSADVIERLLARPAQAEQQPAAWQRRSRPTWDEKHPWSDWIECTKAYHDDIQRIPLLHGWINESRELYAAPIAQTAPQPEQSDIDPLLNAGAALSNIAFNLAQRPGVTLDQHVCDLLSSARKHWDEARAALSATPSPAKRGDA